MTVQEDHLQKVDWFTSLPVTLRPVWRAVIVLLGRKLRPASFFSLCGLCLWQEDVHYLTELKGWYVRLWLWLWFCHDSGATECFSPETQKRQTVFSQHTAVIRRVTEEAAGVSGWCSSNHPKVMQVCVCVCVPSHFKDCGIKIY